MRRIIIISVIIILLVALGIGLYFLFGGKVSPSNLNSTSGGQLGNLPSSAQSNTTGSGVGSSTLPDYIGQAADFFGPLPTSTYISIGTSQGAVQVNNFYLSNPPVDEAEDVAIKQTTNYYIVYDPSSSSFWLGIISVPFANWRTVVEADFLTTLGISQADACKLNVTVGVVYSPGNPDNGQSFPLSFCSGGAFEGR
jgi:hypothetical protein